MEKGSVDKIHENLFSETFYDSCFTGCRQSLLGKRVKYKIRKNTSLTANLLLFEWEI